MESPTCIVRLSFFFIFPHIYYVDGNKPLTGQPCTNCDTQETRSNKSRQEFLYDKQRVAFQSVLKLKLLSYWNNIK